MRHLPLLPALAVSVVFLLSCSRQGAGDPPSDIAVAERVISVHKDSLYTDPQETMRHLSAVRRQLTDSSAVFRLDLIIDITRLLQGDGKAFDDTRRRVGRFCTLHPDDHALTGLYWNACGIADMVAGRRDAAIDGFRASWRELAAAQDTARACDVSINLASLLREKGETADAAGVLQDASILSRKGGRVPATIRFAIRYMLAAVYADMNSFGMADSWFREAARLLPQASVNDQYMFHNARGNRYFFDKQLLKAWADFTESKRLAAQLHSPVLTAIAESNLGEVLHSEGHDRQAMPLLLNAERTLKDGGVSDAQSAAYLNDLIASTTAHAGDRAAAARRFRATDTTAIADNPRYMMTHYERLADYYHLCGDDARAYGSLRQARRCESMFRNKIFTEQMADAQQRYRRDRKVMSQELELEQQRKRVEGLRMGIIFIVVFSLVVVGGVVWSQRRKRQLLLLQYQRQLTQLSLQNIRNRLSPHFVMNVLGRELSMDNEGVARLVKFIRQNLMLVEQTVIPLSEELDFVNTYVELERKSLPTDFAYSCHVDASIDVGQLQVPAMLLQVFVENAVKHGLRGQQGSMFLRVDVLKADGGIMVTIDNNGSDAQSDTGTHTGMSLVRQTVDLFNRYNQEPVRFDSGLRDAGVWHVEIFIPTGYNFRNMKE